MKVSPLSIKKQEFKKTLRGYDIEEVHAFLDNLSDEFERLVNDNDKLKEELDEAKNQIVEFRRIEKNLQDTLLKAHESSSKSIESAKKQTNLMIKEAEIKAAQIIDKARESANEIRNAVIKLREERDVIIARLRAIIDTQSHLLQLKVETTDKEKTEIKKAELPTRVEVDVQEILNKLT